MYYYEFPGIFPDTIWTSPGISYSLVQGMFGITNVSAQATALDPPGKYDITFCHRLAFIISKKLL